MQRLIDHLKEIFYYLWQYKSRTFMTMFGIVWGTLTIIVLLAFGVGLQKFMSREMHGMGEGIAIVWPGRTSIPFEGYGRDRNIRFRYEDAALIKSQIEEIEYLSPEYSRWSTPVRLADKVQRPNIAGVVPEYSPMRNIWWQKGGRWFNDKDLEERRRVVFLGDDLKNFLFGEDTDAIGKYVKLGETSFRVIGVLQHKNQNSSYSSRDKDKAFIPATTFASIFGHRYINNFVYKLKDPRDADLVQTKLYNVFAKKFKFDPKDKETLGIWDTTENDKFLFYFFLGFNIFMGIIGVITLIVGGIGLANIMYVVVQERTREIGIRRSIGAKQRHIMGQFILEAFIIIGISGALGFLLGYGLVKLLSLMPIDQYVGSPEVSWGVAFAAMMVLGLIGFLAGYFPSRKAAKLEVVDCLRS